MGNFLDALGVEIESLERQLEADPRFVKLKALRVARAAYVADNPSKVVERTAPPPLRHGNQSTILDALRQILAGRSMPTPTREIMDLLAERGITVGGQTPQNTVSSIMSKSDEFTAMGRSGWVMTRDSDTLLMDEPPEGGPKDEEGDTSSGNERDVHGDPLI